MILCDWMLMLNPNPQKVCFRFLLSEVQYSFLFDIFSYLIAWHHFKYNIYSSSIAAEGQPEFRTKRCHALLAN
jgi:hypothetical protein